LKKSKKANAFDLFSQDFTPSSPEVRALGLHSSNRYKYYSEWGNLEKPLRSSGQGKSTMVNSTKPNGGTIAKPKGQTHEVQSEPIVPEEQIPGGVEEDQEEIEKTVMRKPKAQDEVGVINETVSQKGREEKTEGHLHRHPLGKLTGVVKLKHLRQKLLRRSGKLKLKINPESFVNSQAKN